MGASINNLPARTPSAGDQVPFFSSPNGQDSRCSITELAALIAQSYSVPGALVTQFAAPLATGFTVAVAPPTSGASMWVIITPAAGYAAGTIVYPAVDTLADGQELLFVCTESVGTLTTNGNGAVVNGAPAALSGDDYFRMKFSKVAVQWYRIG